MLDRLFISNGLLLLSVISPFALKAAANTDFINEIPDFTQSQITGWEHRNGSQYCGPVAVSNSLYWLAGMTGSPENLIKLLASSRYMNTDVRKGTRTTQMLNGIHAMATDMFGGYGSLEYQGWKLHPSRFSAGIMVPDFHWITQELSQDAAVWLNVGWYRYDREENLYHRVGGHWVTLVGYDRNVLIIHDPAPRAGQSFANEYVHTSVIKSGTLAGRLAGLPRSAEGYLLLGNGMHIKSTADVAIVDGAIRLKL